MRSLGITKMPSFTVSTFSRLVKVSKPLVTSLQDHIRYVLMIDLQASNLVFVDLLCHTPIWYNACQGAELGQAEWKMMIDHCLDHPSCPWTRCPFCGA